MMYDLDVAGILEHLKCIPEATLLVSSPCIELWFLLHCTDCSAELNQSSCVKKYQAFSEHYTKGKLNVKDFLNLAEGEDRAIDRAKRLTSPRNPSTTVYKLIEALKESRNE